MDLELWIKCMIGFHRSFILSTVRTWYLRTIEARSRRCRHWPVTRCICDVSAMFPAVTNTLLIVSRSFRGYCRLHLYHYCRPHSTGFGPRLPQADALWMAGTPLQRTTWEAFGSRWSGGGGGGDGGRGTGAGDGRVGVGEGRGGCTAPRQRTKSLLPATSPSIWTPSPICRGIFRRQLGLTRIHPRTANRIIYSTTVYFYSQLLECFSIQIRYELNSKCINAEEWHVKWQRITII